MVSEDESQVWSLRSNSMVQTPGMHSQKALENEDISHLLEGDLKQKDFKMKKLEYVYKLLGKTRTRERG